jgi:SNF2 family DNA or RNA helicase
MRIRTFDKLSPQTKTYDPRMTELRERLAKVSLILRKIDCLDLPEKTYSEVTVEMTQLQQKVYDEMALFLMAEFEQEGEIQATMAQAFIVRIMRLAQICSGFIKNADNEVVEIPQGNPKIEALREILENHPANEKIVIWARFTFDCHRISKLLTEMNISHGIINGETKEALRNEYATSFNTANGIRIIVGEPGSGGEGLNFVGAPQDEAPCTLAIRYSNDFSIIKYTQAEDRTHRIGMGARIHYIDLMVENSIDQAILGVLHRKRALGNEIKDVDAIKALIHGELPA